jgi:hypothetical protein
MWSRIWSRNDRNFRNSRLLKRVDASIGRLHTRLLLDSIWTVIHDKHSGSMKINTHLDHISHRKTKFGTNSSDRWTYRVFIINTRHD